MPTPRPSWQSFIGFAKESTWGVPVTPTVFIPAQNAKVDRKYNYDYDQAPRGNASMDHSATQAEGHGEVEFNDVRVYPDDTIHFFMAMLGIDTVTGTNPYTHTITLDNTGTQPPSYTVAKYDALAGTAVQSAGVQFSQIALKYASPGIMTLSAKGLGKLPTDATKPTPSYTTSTFYVPWNAALTLNSSANTDCVDMTVTLDRAIQQFWGMGGTQDVTSQNVDRLKVTGNSTFIPGDYTEYNLFKNATQPPISVLFTSGTNTLTIQMSKSNYEDAPVDTSAAYAKIAGKWTAIANATDAGTGNAPIKIVAVNAKSAAY